MKNKNQGDNTYTSLIFVSLVLLVIIGLSLGTTPESTSPLFSSSVGGDLIPSVGDLDPSITQKTVAENIALGNYTFYFEDTGFSFSGLGVMIFGFLAKLFFEVAVLCSKGLTLLLNVSMNSTTVASLGGVVLKSLGQGPAQFLSKVFYIIMPIGYGLWAIWNGIARKKYVMAVTGIVGAIMLYSVGTLMLTQGPQILKGMTATSSQLAQGFMTLGDNNGKGNPLIVMNDDIWLSQVFIPWSVNQFATTGTDADPTQLRDAKGNLKLSIPMNPWEESELKGYVKGNGTLTVTGDWYTTLMGPTELNTKEVTAVQSVLSNPKNPRVIGGWKASPVGAAFSSLFLVIINLLQFVITGVPALIVIIADALLVTCMLAAQIVFFVALVPDYGSKVYKAYLNVIISAFVAKILYGVLAGLYISSITSAYIGMYNMVGHKAYAITLAGIVAIIINLSFILLGWVLWKKVGVISIGTFATNVATGNWDSARSQWEESKLRNSSTADNWLMNGRFSPLRNFAGNEDFNKYILGADAEQILQSEMNKIRQTQAQKGELSEKEVARLDALIDRSEQLQNKSKDSKDFSIYQNMTRRGKEFKAEIMQQELSGLEKEYDNGNGDMTQDDYKKKLALLSDSAKELEDESVSAPSVQRAAMNIRNRVMSQQSSLDIKSIESYQTNLGKFTEGVDQLEEKHSRGGMTDRAYNKAYNELLKDYGHENADTKQTEAPTSEGYLNLIDNSYQSLMKSAEQTTDDKTYSMLNKAASNVAGYRKELIDKQLQGVSELGRLDLIEDMRENTGIQAIPELSQYVEKIYNSEKIKLLDAQENSKEPGERLDFWKGKITEQLHGIDGETDQSIVDYAKKKVEKMEISEIQGISERLLGYGTALSATELNALKERTEQALNDYVSSGDNKEKVTDILSKINITQLIDQVSVQSYGEQSDVLHKAMADATSEGAKNLLVSRIADVDANMLKETMLDTMNRINTVVQRADSGDLTPETLLAEFDEAIGNLIVPVADIARCIKENNYEYINNVYTFHVGEELKKAYDLIPVNDQVSGQIMRRKINAANAVEQDIGWLSGNKDASVSDELRMESMVEGLTKQRAEIYGESQAKFGRVLHDKIASQNISVMDSIIKDMRSALLQSTVDAAPNIREELNVKVSFLDDIIKFSKDMVEIAMEKQTEGIREAMRQAEANEKGQTGRKNNGLGGDSDGGVDLS
jgi:hypothetical protein